MGSRYRRYAAGWTLVLAVLTIDVRSSQAAAYGLSSFSILPPSGTADDNDVLQFDMAGTSGDHRTPLIASFSQLSTYEYVLNLHNPQTIGLTVITPWVFQTFHGPLPAGTYDFYVSGTRGDGFSWPAELQYDDFVIIPEPSTAALGLVCLGCLAASLLRRCSHRSFADSGRANLRR